MHDLHCFPLLITCPLPSTWKCSINISWTCWHFCKLGTWVTCQEEAALSLCQNRQQGPAKLEELREYWETRKWDGWDKTVPRKHWTVEKGLHPTAAGSYGAQEMSRKENPEKPWPRSSAASLTYSLRSCPCGGREGVDPWARAPQRANITSINTRPEKESLGQSTKIFRILDLIAIFDKCLTEIIIYVSHLPSRNIFNTHTQCPQMEMIYKIIKTIIGSESPTLGWRLF